MSDITRQLFALRASIDSCVAQLDAIFEQMGLGEDEDVQPKCPACGYEGLEEVNDGKGTLICPECNANVRAGKVVVE